jgi:hypothetical protein
MASAFVGSTPASCFDHGSELLFRKARGSNGV